jgi:hypothetical protein
MRNSNKEHQRFVARSIGAMFFAFLVTIRNGGTDLGNTLRWLRLWPSSWENGMSLVLYLLAVVAVLKALSWSYMAGRLKERASRE